MKLYDFTKHDSLYEKIQKSDKKKYIYGMGEAAGKILTDCNKYDIKISGLFVDDEYFTVEKYHDLPVYKKSELLKQEKEFDTLLAIGKAEENIQDIKYYTFSDKGYVYKSIYGFYFDWDKEFIQKNALLLEQTFNWLEDDYSKCIFNAYAQCCYEGDNSDLLRLATFPQYFPEMINLTKKTTFIDMGAYTGDTIEYFLSQTNNNYAEIYAFELDPYNYNKLKQNTMNLPNIYIYNVGLSSENTECFFDAAKDCSSVVTEKNEVSKGILRTLDSYDLKVTGDTILLKADIEKSELPMLRGAKDFIQKHKPQLAICVYHRPEDLITIPQYIKQLNPEYKLFLRHHSNRSTETVLYAI